MIAQHTPHPVQTLNALCKRYPNLTQQVNAAWSKKLADPGLWPEWCLLPMDEWARIIEQQEQLSGNALPIEVKFRDLYLLSAVGTWKFSQGVYRVDKTFQQALLESDLGKDIPADVLMHMPEWCIYVETPDERWKNSVELLGFWAHISYSEEHNYPKLNILLLTSQGECRIPGLPLGNWPIDEAFEREFSEMESKVVGNYTFPAQIENRMLLSKWRSSYPHIERLLHIILYCCCDKPDIDDARQPGTSPQRPQAKQVKGGFRLFPANAPRFWTVGNNIGEQLRQAQQDNQEKETSCGSGRSRRPHLRRGHWHGYWTGPRKSEVPQKFILHWIPPQLIRGSGEEALQEV